MMKELTISHIRKNSEPHPHIEDGEIYHEKIGDYTLSIIGGGRGLYGDFVETFEVALIDDEGEFATKFYSTRGDDVMAYATIDEINDLYFNIPRKKFPRSSK